MWLPLVCALPGVIFGALLLGYGGWLLGGLLGFLVGMSLRLSQRLSASEDEIARLKQWRAQLSESQIPKQTPLEGSSTSISPLTVPPSPRQVAQQVLPGQAEQAVSKQTASQPGTPPSAIDSLELELPEPLSEPSSRGASTSTRPSPTGAAAASSNDPWGQVRSSPLGDALKQKISNFFTQGNPIVRVGMVVLFFGLSFLVKYASSQGLFPIELRMAMVAAVALVLIFLGWKTRTREGGYGLVLQGGGVAALYLTLFAAAKFYSLMPPGVAFSVMFLVVLLGAALALLQSAQVLALMSTAGGFLAPILTSDGSGNYLGLFSYYLLLNLGVLGIALFKSWRRLNWVGFVFTFVIAAIWAFGDYQPAHYLSVQPFMAGFFVLYLAVSVLFSIKQPPRLKGLVDASLVFGLPIAAFGIQTLLLKHTEFGLAISALVLAAIYAFLTRFLWARFGDSQRVLSESFIALAVGFATLAIPLALGAQWTSASWALEATGLVWVGLRQQRRLPRAAGYLLHLGAAFALLRTGGLTAGEIPLLTGDFISLLVLAITAATIAYLLERYPSTTHRLEALARPFIGVAPEPSLRLAIVRRAWLLVVAARRFVGCP